MAVFYGRLIFSNQSPPLTTQGVFGHIFQGRLKVPCPIPHQRATISKLTLVITVLGSVWLQFFLRWNFGDNSGDDCGYHPAINNISF